MGCGESKEKNKIAPDKEDDITPKIYSHNETIEDISVPSSQVPSTSTESSEKRHGNSIFLFDQRSVAFLSKFCSLTFLENLLFLGGNIEKSGPINFSEFLGKKVN